MRVALVSCVRPARRTDGGASPALVQTARAGASAGMQVDVVQAAWQDGRAERGGIGIHSVAEPIPSRLSAAVPLRLLQAVRALRPDVIHLRGTGFPVQTRLLCSAGIPVLVQDDGGGPPPDSWCALLRPGYARIDGAAFTAREQAEPFRAAGVLRAEVPVFEVMGATTRFTAGSRESARAELGVYGDPCVLWTAPLTVEDDPLTALEGFARATERLCQARLWMAYRDAAMEAQLVARVVDDARLRGRVHLLGRVPHAQVQALCRAADLFLASSRRAGSGQALLEALACGAVPLAPDLPAARRILRGGEGGALFAPGDAQALAEQIVAHAARDREAARRCVVDHFDHYLSPPAIGEELRAAYEGVAR
jgi:Glycosyl transferases group 1/Glycosyl transferase 4-like domain